MHHSYDHLCDLFAWSKFSAAHKKQEPKGDLNLRPSGCKALTLPLGFLDSSHAKQSLQKHASVH